MSIKTIHSLTDKNAMCYNVSYVKFSMEFLNESFRFINMSHFISYVSVFPATRAQVRTDPETLRRYRRQPAGACHGGIQHLWFLKHP